MQYPEVRVKPRLTFDVTSWTHEEGSRQVASNTSLAAANQLAEALVDQMRATAHPDAIDTTISSHTKKVEPGEAEPLMRGLIEHLANDGDGVTIFNRGGKLEFTWITPMSLDIIQKNLTRRLEKLQARNPEPPAVAPQAIDLLRRQSEEALRRAQLPEDLSDLHKTTPPAGIIHFMASVCLKNGSSRFEESTILAVQARTGETELKVRGLLEIARARASQVRIDVSRSPTKGRLTTIYTPTTTAP